MKPVLLLLAILIATLSTAVCSSDDVSKENGHVRNTASLDRQAGNNAGNEAVIEDKKHKESPSRWLHKSVDEQYAFAQLREKFKAAAQQRFLMGKAVLVYLEGAKRYPGHKDAPRAFYLAGEIERIRGKRDAALAAYNSVIDDFPENDYADEAQFRIAGLSYAEKNFEKAQKQYYRLIDTYLRSDLVPESYLMVARCYQEIMSYGNALSTYQKILDTYDDTSVRFQALKGLAETCLKSDDHDKAISTYELILAEYPDSSAYDHAEYMLAKTYAMQGNYPAARRIFRTIVDTDDMNAYSDEAAYAKAWTYHDEEKYAHAIECYSLAMTRYPDHQEYQNALANVADSYAKLYLYRDALIRYEELLHLYKSKDTAGLTPAEKEELDERIGNALFTMGRIHSGKEELEEALTTLFEARKYLKNTKDGRRADFAIAELYCKLGWYREALEAYDEFIAKNPFAVELTVAYAHKAKCYDKMGYYQLAGEMYLKVIDAKPDEITLELAYLKQESVYRIADLYEEQDMIREEAEFLECALAAQYEFLEESRVLYKLGTVYEELHRFEKAESAYEEILFEHKESEWFDLAKLNLEIIRINKKSKDGRN